MELKLIICLVSIVYLCLIFSIECIHESNSYVALLRKLEKVTQKENYHAATSSTVETA